MYHYREGGIQDMPALISLGMDAYGQFQTILKPEYWERLHAVLVNPGTYMGLLEISECLVCCKGQEVIGMAFLVSSGNPTDIFPADWSYIRMVGVAGAYEGQGIGKQLTMLCIDRARKNGEEIIGLHTSEFMDSARHIYENLGFLRIGDIPPRFGKKYYLYRLEL